MHWVVGIDEAGYGPNLGPLTQAAVALKLPKDDRGGWDTLRPHVRRAGEKKDKRVLVDDSKLVHQGKDGLKKLESGIRSLFSAPKGDSFIEWLKAIAIRGVVDDLSAEFWFDGEERLPLDSGAVVELRTDLDSIGAEARIIAAKLTTTPVFNKVVEGSGSKATVLTIGLSDLLNAAIHSLPGNEAIYIVCDKQGGRNHYAPALQHAFPNYWVTTETESADESRYRIEGAERPIALIFVPRADSASAAAAAASMLCKYLREVCMSQFNRFWSKHVPDIKPTAGYPQDAKRFFGEIRPAMEKLGLAEHAVWRVK